MENMENGVVEQTTDGGVVATEEVNVTEKQSDQVEVQEKKYTDADVDRIVSKKISRERDRLQKLFKEEQQVSDLDERERNVSIREMKADAREELERRGLPLRLADMLNFSDRETMEKGLDSLEQSFREAVAFGIKDAIRGEVPRTGHGYHSIEAEKALHNAFKAR